VGGCEMRMGREPIKKMDGKKNAKITTKLEEKS